MDTNLVSPQNLKPGIAPVVYIALKSWFTAIKKPVPPFDQEGEEVLITQSHTFKPGRGFLTFALAPQKNKLDAKSTGDLGNNFFSLTPEMFIPGSYAAAHETIRNLLNQPLVALVKDCSCPDEWHIQLGCEDIGCWLTADFTTGTTKDGSKGYTAMLHWTGDSVYFYNGGITLAHDMDEDALLLNGDFLILNNDTLILNA